MKILVTGASGYLGNKLAHTLAGMGHTVHAAVRSDEASAYLQHPNIIAFKADIMKTESLLPAMKGCEQVYHTAAKVGLWDKDPSVFYAVNVEGTRNVLDAALSTGVHRTVITSTCGVIGPSLNKPMTENDPRITGYALDYELSKKMGEDIVFKYAKKGMNVVVVSPTKVYGPGNISHSLTANAMINKFLKKKFAFIPSPGSYKVSCAYIDDIVSGHILAMQRGRTGEKYILSGINLSYYDFFDRIRTISSCSGRIIQLSRNAMKGWAFLQQAQYKLTGIHPTLTVKSIDALLCNYTFSGEKAVQELGYTITPLDEAIKKTVHFLKHADYEK